MFVCTCICACVYSNMKILSKIKNLVLICVSGARDVKNWHTHIIRPQACMWTGNRWMRRWGLHLAASDHQSAHARKPMYRNKIRAWNTINVHLQIRMAKQLYTRFTTIHTHITYTSACVHMCVHTHSLSVSVSVSLENGCAHKTFSMLFGSFHPKNEWHVPKRFLLQSLPTCMLLRQLITWRTILLHVPSSLHPAIWSLPVLNTWNIATNLHNISTAEHPQKHPCHVKAPEVTKRSRCWAKKNTEQVCVVVIQKT
jgi:hypothetical protein